MDEVTFELLKAICKKAEISNKEEIQSFLKSKDELNYLANNKYIHIISSRLPNGDDTQAIKIKGNINGKNYVEQREKVEFKDTLLLIFTGITALATVINLFKK